MLSLAVDPKSDQSDQSNRTDLRVVLFSPARETFAGSFFSEGMRARRLTALNGVMNPGRRLQVCFLCPERRQAVKNVAAVNLGFALDRAYHWNGRSSYQKSYWLQMLPQ